jgi:hypothetical protein
LARIWLGFLTDNRRKANRGTLWLSTPKYINNTSIIVDRCLDQRETDNIISMIVIYIDLVLKEEIEMKTSGLHRYSLVIIYVKIHTDVVKVTSY